MYMPKNPNVLALMYWLAAIGAAMGNILGVRYVFIVVFWLVDLLPDGPWQGSLAQVPIFYRQFCTCLSLCLTYWSVYLSLSQFPPGGHRKRLRKLFQKLSPSVVKP